MAAYLAETCRLFVLLVLGVAAAGKTWHFVEFRRGLADSFPLLGRISNLMAILIIGAEWLIAALILVVDTARIGLAAAVPLFALFATVIAYSQLRGDVIVCQCFGASSHRVSVFDLWRNLLYLVASVYGLYALVPNSMMESASRAALIGLACVAFLISTALQDVVALLRVQVED